MMVPTGDTLVPRSFVDDIKGTWDDAVFRSASLWKNIHRIVFLGNRKPGFSEGIAHSYFTSKIGGKRQLRSVFDSPRSGAEKDYYPIFVAILTKLTREIGLHLNFFPLMSFWVDMAQGAGF